MLKTTRLAALAAVLFVAASTAVVPLAAQAQTPRAGGPGGLVRACGPRSTATPAAPADKGRRQARPKSSTTRTGSRRC